MTACWRCDAGYAVSDDGEHWGEGDLVTCRNVLAAEASPASRAGLGAPPAPDTNTEA